MFEREREGEGEGGGVLIWLGLQYSPECVQVHVVMFVLHKLYLYIQVRLMEMYLYNNFTLLILLVPSTYWWNTRSCKFLLLSIK